MMCRRLVLHVGVSAGFLGACVNPFVPAATATVYSTSVNGYTHNPVSKGCRAHDGCSGPAHGLSVAVAVLKKVCFWGRGLSTFSSESQFYVESRFMQLYLHRKSYLKEFDVSFASKAQVSVAVICPSDLINYTIKILLSQKWTLSS